MVIFVIVCCQLYSQFKLAGLSVREVPVLLSGSMNASLTAPQIGIGDWTPLLSFPSELCVSDNHQQAIRAAAKDTYTHIAIAIISIGNKSTAKKASFEQCLQSIRRRGMWPTGRIIIVSDQEAKDSNRFGDIIQSDGHITPIYVKKDEILKRLKMNMPVVKRFKTLLVSILLAKWLN
jgi:hypothetical protein